MTSRPMSDADRRFPRRFLLAAPAAVAVGGVAGAAPAVAAPPGAAWKLGGNVNVSSDGDNFLGPTNGAPLIIKTTGVKPAAPVERMRVQGNGRVGIGTTNPTARLEVRNTGTVAVSGTSTAAADDAVGVLGVATGDREAASGVKGTHTGIGMGVSGISADGVGVYALGGVDGAFAQGGFTGIYAHGDDEGVFGSGEDGVVGLASGGTGVIGDADAGENDGVPPGPYGVWGYSGATAGVRGDSDHVGVMGRGDDYGVSATALAQRGLTFGIYATASSPGGYAGWFQGRCHVNGTLSKSAGAFEIDHPLAPEERWLRHSFVESPDMMNVYNGNVVLDDAGEATVELPSYFAALNGDPRYQLTCIGGHAPVHVAAKVRRNRFRIAGGTPGLEVSWQVTGVRRDDYAEAHRVVVEEDKGPTDRGRRAFVPEGSASPALQRGPGDVPAPEPVRRRRPPAVG